MTKEKSRSSRNSDFLMDRSLFRVRFPSLLNQKVPNSINRSSSMPKWWASSFHGSSIPKSATVPWKRSWTVNPSRTADDHRTAMETIGSIVLWMADGRRYQQDGVRPHVRLQDYGRLAGSKIKAGDHLELCGTITNTGSMAWIFEHISHLNQFRSVMSLF